jgi:hypothetical protein
MSSSDILKSGVPGVTAGEWNLLLDELQMDTINFDDDFGYIKDACVQALVYLFDAGAVQPVNVSATQTQVEQKEEKKEEGVVPPTNLCTLAGLQELCTKWVKLYSAGHDDGGGTLPMIHLGYAPKHVTPYVHCVARHCCEFIAEHGSLWRFSCQSLERRNAAHTRQLLQNGLMRSQWPRRMIQRDLRLLVNAWVPRGKFHCPKECGHLPFTYETSFKKHCASGCQ